MPPPSPGARWALAPPFHPYRGEAFAPPWRGARATVDAGHARAHLHRAPGGWAAAGSRAGGGWRKVRAPQEYGAGQRPAGVKPQGKCHREQTARPPRGRRVRVKGCGKSAPRPRRRGRHGKPHREQGRIGAAGGACPGVIPRQVEAGAFLPRRPGWPREACRKARPRGMVAHPHNSRGGQNPAYRPPGALCPQPFHRLVPSSFGALKKRNTVRPDLTGMFCISALFGV